MTLQQRIEEGRKLLEDEESPVVDVLHNVMTAVDKANQIVLRRHGNPTSADKRPLIRLANDLEGYAVDLMSAAKRL